MAKKGMKSVIVIGTIQCLVEGEKKRFLPSDEPQDIPLDVAAEVIKRGLAKEKAPVKRKPASKSTGEGETGVSVDGSDDDGAGDVNV